MIPAYQTVHYSVATSDYPQLNQRYDDRFCSYIFHNWDHHAARHHVCEGLFKTYFEKVELEDDKPTRLLPHFRALSLACSDGTTLEIRLDQGVGYWGTSQPVRFDFSQTNQNQVVALERCNLKICARHPEFPTYIYLV